LHWNSGANKNQQNRDSKFMLWPALSRDEKAISGTKSIRQGRIFFPFLKADCSLKASLKDYFSN